VVDILPYLEGLAYVGFIAGAIFAVLELRTMSRDRRTDMMMRLMELFSTREFHQIEDKFSHSNAVDAKSMEQEISWGDLTFIADCVEYLSFLARRNLIDKKLVLEFYDLDSVWNKLRPWVVSERERTDNDELYSDFEWMAKVQAGHEASG
jgi:hypothetical protein